MWKDALLITIACVLFVQMGLSEAIQGRLHFTSELLSCPRCCSFWANLAYFIIAGTPLVVTVSASFLCAYAALWLALGYDAAAALYNRAYEYISKTNGASTGANASDNNSDTITPCDTDAVSEVQ